MLDALAIDGPAGSGKSTVARAAARELGFLYLDTGAMYRALAWKALKLGVNLEDGAALAALAPQTRWEFADDGARLLLDGEDVSAAIRSPEVTANTRFAARVPEVRAHLVALQRQMAAKRPAATEGRDITTVVLPDAKWRLFLTASPEARAERRVKDNAARGFAADREAILRDILDRDASDDAIGPLAEARRLAMAGEGIALFDTSALTQDAVVAAVVAWVRNGAPLPKA